MEGRISPWRKPAVLCLVGTLVVGTISSGRGQDRWWDKPFGVGFRYSSGLYSRAFINKYSPHIGLEAKYAYFGVDNERDKSLFDLGTKATSYEVFLSFSRQKFHVTFGQSEHSFSRFRKESPPVEFVGESTPRVFVWEGEFASKLTYAGYSLYFPILTSEAVGRVSIGIVQMVGHVKNAKANYYTYEYEHGDPRRLQVNTADYRVTFSAWGGRLALSLRYDYPGFPVSVELSLGAEGYALNTLKGWGEWEIYSRVAGAGGWWKETDKDYRERGLWKEPVIGVLEILPSVSLTMPL
ncbi:MAG: hypothetical protein ONB25_12965 [candidate division KSB1 bacterium]|nr:hypothetical protein [candidate division KSB1 bacterium]MDZ7413934.1 hypothetical protein [candidate division KSB1 bacterium]